MVIIRSLMRRVRNHALVAAAAIIAACGDSGGPTAVPPEADIVQSVELRAPEHSVEVGLPVDLSVLSRDADGILVPGARVVWRSLDPALATVDSTGRVQPLAPGSARIVASVGAVADTATLQAVAPLDFVAIHAALSHTCGLTRNGTAYCWGSNSNGELGNGTSAGSIRPVAVSGGHQFASITGGFQHTCARTSEGIAYCWGGNFQGQLGNGSLEMTSVPVPVAANGAFTSVSAGSYHTCGVLVGGEGLCWGAGTHGQLGDGSRVSSSSPVRVSGNHSFVTISAGGSSTCGLTEGGEAYCWSIGDVNNGPGTGPVVPAATTTELTFTSISTGTHHSCALTVDGQAYCWGRNFHGELGDGTFAPFDNDWWAVETPQEVVGGHRFSSIVAGDARTCGVSTAGRALCWGSGQFGALGNGDTGNVNQPTGVNLGPVIVEATASRLRGCAITTEGRAYCWGDNSAGGLGAGDTAWSRLPRRVTVP